MDVIEEIQVENQVKVKVNEKVNHLENQNQKDLIINKIEVVVNH